MAVAAAVTATIVATSYCDPVASAAGRGGSLATAALSALDDLDERRLVGTDAPDLSRLKVGDGLRRPVNMETGV
jgi:hypothetical protein